MATITSDTSRLLQALQFAADRHRAQRRKDESSSPYINHPIEVAHVLAVVGDVKDVMTLVAAFLHDTLEDTATTPEELQERFGRGVRELVGELTDDKELPRRERERLQVERAAGYSDPAKMIRIADKICNVRDVAFAPPARWSRARCTEYLDWSERVVAACRGVNEALESRYDKVLREGRFLLASDEQ